MTLARAWEAAAGFPAELRSFVRCVRGFREIEPLLIIPEYKVPLPGGRRESQADVFVLARRAAGPVAIAVEGKVDEAFGPTVAERQADSSGGVGERLRGFYPRAGQPTPAVVRIRGGRVYMNTVSAFIRGKRRARLAVSLMLVIAVCVACDSRTPTRPSQAFSPSAAPSPSPAPPPAVAHQVEIAWEPDHHIATAPIDRKGAYLLEWGAGWYCVGVTRYNVRSAASLASAPVSARMLLEADYRAKIEPIAMLLSAEASHATRQREL